MAVLIEEINGSVCEIEFHYHNTLLLCIEDVYVWVHCFELQDSTSSCRKSALLWCDKLLLTVGYPWKWSTWCEWSDCKLMWPLNHIIIDALHTCLKHSNISGSPCMLCMYFSLTGCFWTEMNSEADRNLLCLLLLLIFCTTSAVECLMIVITYDCYLVSWCSHVLCPCLIDWSEFVADVIMCMGRTALQCTAMNWALLQV